MRLVPAVIPETHNLTRYKIFAQVRPDGLRLLYYKRPILVNPTGTGLKAVRAVRRGVKEIF